MKQLRKDKGITLRALIVEYGFHLTQIHRIEKGSGISVQMLLRIAEVLQVPLETLIAGLGRMPEQVDTPPVKGEGTKGQDNATT